MFINFGDIPGHQNLFLDYLYEFENVKEYFNSDFRSRDGYLKIFKSVSEHKNPAREIMPGILKAQYSSLQPSEKTSDNISKLSSDNTLAVVTGQQLGILSGPLYTLYKIITAIKLSESFSQKYDGFNFVPVFWLEGDDHDFNEVRQIKLPDDNNNIKTIGYSTEANEDDDRSSVGTLKFDSSINDFFTNLEQSLRDTEFKPAIISKLKEFYAEGKTFKDAFRELIFFLFDKYGLIIFDPQDNAVKELLKPVFIKEVTDFRLHAEKLVITSAQIEEVYHAQVKIRPLNLFYSNEDGRYLLEPVENDFRLKRKRRKFTFEEIISEINHQPQRFSPNVILRPICQDYLLPTAAYAGGPGEISYLAQVNPLYKFYQIPAPVIYPRSSVMILEKNILNVLEKYDLDLLDIIIDPEKVKQKIVEKVSDFTVEETFKDAVIQFEMGFDKIKEGLFRIDKTTADASNRYKTKILSYVDELKEKALEAQKRKHETILRQIDKVSTAVFPHSVLQEREINFVYYWNKYGDDFLKKLFDEIEIGHFEHQVIKI